MDTRRSVLALGTAPDVGVATVGPVFVTAHAASHDEHTLVVGADAPGLPDDFLSIAVAVPDAGNAVELERHRRLELDESSGADE